jgi:sigma-B regulation protein RsbU (phosphoserine phosphatase)
MNTPVTILVVDDEPDLEMLVRQRFRRKIKDGEFAFVFALNGQEALDQLKSDSSIDVIMSDINMPVMDGLTLLSRVPDVNPTVKTVIVSAYGDMQNIRTAMNRGAYDFLTKPIDFEDFESTVRKTIQEVQQIRRGLKAREELSAIQQELSVAARIQQSMLPRRFPPFPGRQDFEIFAEMVPARQVGGDFYDFFLIDSNRLGFVIGDVSGKGVPAAIFMAVARTLIRATALLGGSADDCIKYANGVLARQSDAAMFVTVFYGVLNTASGELEYCIGGHNPAYVFSADRPAIMIGEPTGLLVGAFEQAAYETGRTTLRPGDTILLYTDGVTDANNSAQEEFSPARLEAAIESQRGEGSEQIVRHILSELRAFTGGAAQSDDITLLAVRYAGSN